jgi:hypothetical protein
MGENEKQYIEKISILNREMGVLMEDRNMSKSVES